MRRVYLYIALTVFSFSAAFGQRGKRDTLQLPFQDSVRIVLENTRNTEAMAIGLAFSNVWNGLGQDIQLAVLKQSKIMKKKGYRLRPHFQNYFGAIVDAVNVENADNLKLLSYIRVAGQVIENETVAKASNFFNNSREFFKYHALHYDKSFRLYARDDNYQFDYIKAELPPPPVEADTAANPFDDWNNQDEQTTWEDEPVDTLPQPMAPSWQQPMVLPELIGAVIRFDKLTLNFSTPHDSAFLENTKGTFLLQENLFVGEGGRFNWSTAGLGADSVFYEFSQYYFRTNAPGLKAEQGSLTYVGKVTGKVEGIFEFQSVKHKNETAATYPRFMSYESNIKMLGLGDEHLRYTGGFALNGQRIFSSSVTGGNAHLEVMGDSDKKFEVQSRLFEFKDSTITSKNAALRIYQGNDSIYHPAVQVRYDYNKKLLAVQRSKGMLKDTPFSSSYFKIDFNGDLVRWSLKGDSTGADSLNIFTSAGLSQEPMVIESQDYYDPNDFRLLKGMGFSFHPLVMTAQYAIENGVNEFFTSDLVSYSGKNFSEVHPAMMFLAEKGMIEYQTENGKINVIEKAIHMNESRKNNTDYDNMKIHSVVDGAANATINFGKGYMTVRGVEQFKVSDSLNVLIKPDSSIITILQNRDIKFNGKITAGNFEINGKEFLLKYDSFFISLNKIDSIRFYVTELNAKGQPVRRRINNSMVGADSTAAAAGGLDTKNTEQKQGTLYINRPDNKSGRENIPNFPRLDASAGGVIYFDRKEVLEGAYDRSVFFVVPPFKLDSLSDADPAAINFEGTFISSGMFPAFKEQLHTQPDKSLGFTHAVPDQGYPLYNTSAKLFGAMGLDHAGIRSTGRIDYLAASVESKDFVFYPDSVIAKGNVGKLEESEFNGVSYPQVTLPEFELKWRPKQDKFALENLRDPFSMYNETAQFDGTLMITKKGTLGDGKLLTRGSESTSSEFTFSSKELGARHANFQVKTTNPDKPALAGNDVRMKFNLAENFANISPEVTGTAAIEFPYAQFKTSITDARWDLNTQKITMRKDKDALLEDSYFYTTRKELDSLVFNAEKAEYDIKSQQLKVSGIPFIVVADAKITPENSEILILENSKIEQLKNTTIVIDTLNGYHRLTQGVVDIISRKEFSGYATYQYVNAVNDTFAIKMTDFHLEPITEETKTKSKRQERESIALQQTVANGAVAEKDKLIIAPRIFYKGDMVMYATKPALQLTGYVKLDLKKLKNYNTWIRHQQGGDEKEIFLDFDNALTEEGSKVQAGLHFAEDNSLYITFVFDKRNIDDEDFFLPRGSLFFDKESAEFKIEDRMKAAGEKLSGKVFAYNEDKQEVRFEGPINFFKASKDFNLTASALGSGNLETNDIKMNSFIMADMNIPSALYDAMAIKLMDVIANEGADEGLGDQTELLYKIADIIGERAVKEYETKSLQNYVSLGTIPQLVKPIVFSNTNLKWSQKYKAFYSEGKLGISNIGRNDINGAFEGFMEIRKNEDGTPVFHAFFKASPEAWYYFGYEDNRLIVHSADPAFNDMVAKKTNAAKAKVGELVFIPGTDEEVLSYVNRFRQSYYGLESSYDLGGSTSATKKEKKKTEEDDGF